MTLAASPPPSGPVLVTGAAGFVGRWLIDAWIGDCDLVGVLRPGEPPSAAPLRWAECELSDADAVGKLLAEVRPHWVVHLAAQAVPREAARRPLDALRSNYLAVHHLVTGLAARAPHARLLLVSTGEVYGRRRADDPPAREADACRPENVYAATKRAAERRVAIAVTQTGLDAICARPFNHTGPGRPDQYAESTFARQIAAAERGDGERTVRVGNLTAIRDFSDVRDVVAGYRVLLERGERGGTYNVCSGHGRSVRDVLMELVERARTSIEVREDPARFEPIPAERLALVGDPSALRELGWQPRHTLGQTLADLLADWRERDRG